MPIHKSNIFSQVLNSEVVQKRDQVGISTMSWTCEETRLHLCCALHHGTKKWTVKLHGQHEPWITVPLMLTCTLESLANSWTWFTLPSKVNSGSRIGSHLTPYKTNAYKCGNVAKCSEENREGKCAKLVAAEGELFVDQTYHLPGEVGSWPPEAQKAVEN